MIDVDDVPASRTLPARWPVHAFVARSRERGATRKDKYPHSCHVVECGDLLAERVHGLTGFIHNLANSHKQTTRTLLPASAG